MIKRKICIIVDHPDRDLTGLLYLSEKFVQTNFTVILVPMYFSHEVFLIKPDYLIINHGRKNKDFSSGIDMLIKFAKDNSIGIFVLDTEGGLNFNKIYKKDINQSVKSIDKYFLWGKDKLKLVNPLYKHKFKVTGHPKYDLYNISKYNTKNRSKIVKKLSKNYILIITSFVNLIPEKGIKKDIINFKNNKVSPEFTKKGVKEYTNDFSKSIELFEFIISKNKKQNFVIRTHPFEDINFYIKKFKKYPNVKIENKGDIFFYIINSKLLINHSCQTSFEAVLAKKECFNISNYYNERTKDLKKITKNITDKYFLNKLLKKKTIFSQVRKKKQITFGYINNIKHDSSEIILNEVLKYKKKKVVDYSFHSVFKYYIRTRGYPSLIKFFLKLIIDPKIFLEIKDFFGIGMYKRKKIYIDLITSNLRKSSLKKLRVSKLSLSDYNKKVSLISNSYKIEKKIIISKT